MVVTLFNGRSNDDIGIVAFIGPTFCSMPSDCLPRTLHVVADISIQFWNCQSKYSIEQNEKKKKEREKINQIEIQHAFVRKDNIVRYLWKRLANPMTETMRCKL